MVIINLLHGAGLCRQLCEVDNSRRDAE